MRSNRFRELLDAGQPDPWDASSVHLADVIELVGQTGLYDYIEFTAEYTPFDLHELDNLGRALEARQPHRHDEDRAGAAHAPDHARDRLRLSERAVRRCAHRRGATACVRAVRAEAPGSDGLHGVGMRRDVGTVREAGSPAFVKALDDIVVVLMIEKRQCVEDLDAMLSVKGIDMVQFGSADYAMSIGLAGQWSHPDVVKAETADHRDGAEAGHPSARRDRRPRGGRALPGDGREALLSRLGCRYPA